jgi:hypothetical protein
MVEIVILELKKKFFYKIKYHLLIIYFFYIKKKNYFKIRYN